MGLPQLESCCFVLDLKTGNIVMGCFNAVLSLIMCLVMIVVTCTLTPTPMDDLITEEMRINAEAADTGLFAMSIILTVLFFAKFTFDVFFVYGVIMERPAIIKSYFVMWIVFLLLSMFTFFLNVQGYGAGTICMEIFYIGLNIYAILLSHSFYKLLNTREEV